MHLFIHLNLTLYLGDECLCVLPGVLEEPFNAKFFRCNIKLNYNNSSCVSQGIHLMMMEIRSSHLDIDHEFHCG